MDPNLRQRLKNQMSRGEVILFTGAGFSMAARNTSGSTMPSVGRLRELLWPIAFPDQNIDQYSTLADIYEVASHRAGRRVGELLKAQLKADAKNVPECYRVWFSMPWARIYTVNVDDLDEAAQRAFKLPRRVHSLSALRDGLPGDTADLLSIHLNGRVDDYPDVTFSHRQYGERTARHDPWYYHLVTDLSSHPVVFVGTTLDEPLLWQHIELRRAKEPRTRELRPGSYLVTPELPAARRAMLQEFNIQLVEMTQEQFATEVLEQMEPEKQQGSMALARRLVARAGGKFLHNVTELRTKPDTSAGEFLLGREPTWGDIDAGTAVKREFENELKALIDQKNKQLTVVTGTAGTGKSTTLMRLALTYAAEGLGAWWLDSDIDLPRWHIRNEVRDAKPDVLFIDDADLFNLNTGALLSDLASDNPDMQLIAGMRSTRYEKTQLEANLKDCPFELFAVPYLEDSDIELLLDALTKANRLGELRKLTRDQQVAAFQREAGRQLLVAMIQATSNERFDDKVDSECQELGTDLGLIYATVALATSLRNFLTRDEILFSIGDMTNEALNRVHSLIKQRLLVETNLNQIRVRHRVIAEKALDYYRKNGQLREPIRGLLWTMATRVQPDQVGRSRENVLLSQLMNHEFMIRLTDDKFTPRIAYNDVEDVLAWNYHYYLQRGSYEVEIGDLDLAKNFLDQARGLAPDDYKVQTEWAYMTLKRASRDAASVGAGDRAEEALTELEHAISRRGKTDSYPYHVIGSQGLAWVRRAIISKEEKARLLTRLRAIVDEGARFHPRQRDLGKLAKDLEREYLMLAVGNS